MGLNSLQLLLPLTEPTMPVVENTLQPQSTGGDGASAAALVHGTSRAAAAAEAVPAGVRMCWAASERSPHLRS